MTLAQKVQEFQRITVPTGKFIEVKDKEGFKKNNNTDFKRER